MIQGIYEIRRERALDYMMLARKKYESAVRPIYGFFRRGIAPKHVGSCVLLSIRGARFLATAGHVTDEAKHVTLRVAGASGLVPLSLDGGITTRAALTRDQDVYDLSIIPLSEVVQTALGNVTYISEAAIYSRPPLGRNRLLMAMGYPTSKNKRGIDNPAKRISGTLWTYVSLSEDNDPEDNIFLEFDHEISINSDGLGTHSLMPRGASGGALFDLGKLDDPERLARPAQCEGKLVGILIEYRKKKKVIAATPMMLVIAAVDSLQTQMPAK